MTTKQCVSIVTSGDVGASGTRTSATWVRRRRCYYITPVTPLSVVEGSTMFTFEAMAMNAVVIVDRSGTGSRTRSP